MVAQMHAMTPCTVAILFAVVVLAGYADAHLTVSSLQGAIAARHSVLRRGVVAADSNSDGIAPNAYKGAPICTASSAFSIDAVAREFPQFYSELGTWVGNATCYTASASGTPGTPLFVDGPTVLNTTIDAGRLVSCSSLAGGATSCRAFYPRFDGSGQYCTVEPDDLDTFGYPALNQGQVINGRVSIDTVWPNVGSLYSGVFSYYEPTNDAITSFYGAWNQIETSGTTGPALLCFMHYGRTCRGPACFTPPASLA